MFGSPAFRSVQLDEWREAENAEEWNPPTAVYITQKRMTHDNARAAAIHSEARTPNISSLHKPTYTIGCSIKLIMLISRRCISEIWNKYKKKTSPLHNTIDLQVRHRGFRIISRGLDDE